MISDFNRRVLVDGYGRCVEGRERLQPLKLGNLR